MKLVTLTKIKDRLLEWYSENFYQIEWFIIGFLVAAGFRHIKEGDEVMAMITFGLAGINYIFVRKG